MADGSGAEPHAINRDYTVPLWLLKLGALLNVYFLLTLPEGGDSRIVDPARILFVVSAYRCLFPVRYEHNVVFHDWACSSIFLTRLLATFAEVAYIFQFSYVLRMLDTEHVPFVSVLSWIMGAQVVLSQGLAWAAILTGRLALFLYEELGWAVIFVANTAASLYLYFRVGAPPTRHAVLLQLNIVFGALYLPWQFVHLRMLRANARGGSVDRSAHGLLVAIRIRNRRTDAISWGGAVGLSWMIGYWATIIPAWVYAVVLILAAP